MLVDTDLNKLNALKAEFSDRAQIRILPINFSMLRDSTKLEHRLFKMIFDREPLKVNQLSEEATCDYVIPSVPLFINCAQMTEETLEITEMKMFHELQIDQIVNQVSET